MKQPTHERLIVDPAGLRMTVDKKVIDVTAEYARASRAVEDFNPGEQPDIKELMRAAYIHGYAQALIDARSAADGEGKL
jgi:hypothetical protein